MMSTCVVQQEAKYVTLTSLVVPGVKALTSVWKPSGLAYTTLRPEKEEDRSSFKRSDLSVCVMQSLSVCVLQSFGACEMQILCV